MNVYEIKDSAYYRAVDLLDQAPLIDCHNDLPVVIRRDPAAQGDVAAYNLRESIPGRDTSIPQLREGKVSAQIWAAFPPLSAGSLMRTTFEQIDLIKRMNEHYSDVFLPAYTADDILSAKQSGKIASFIAVEGSGGIEGSLDILSIWRRLGVCLLTLCHNETLPWVDSATDASISGGLSDFGRDVVRECNRLGMIVDCAHVSADAMRQVLDTSSRPVVFSHSNAFALSNHPRNVPDDVLARIKETNSMVMATFVPAFISQKSRDWHRALQDEHGKGVSKPNTHGLANGGDSAAKAITAWESQTGKSWVAGNLFQFCDHVEYMAKHAGVDAIGIGSDFYGGPAPDGLESVSCYPHIFAELIRRGWNEKDLVKIASGNFIRLMQDVQKDTFSETK